MAEEDREGEALEREIAADKRELASRRRRRVLFVPPLLALAVAAWALGASRPREVLGGRVWVAARPDKGQKLTFRVEIVSAIPGLEGTTPAARVELRLRDTPGRIDTTDEDGNAEAVVDLDAVHAPAIEIDAKSGQAWRSVATLELSKLLERDPRDGALKLRRSGGAKSGAFLVDVWPERSVLAPPHPGAVWVRVLQSGAAVPGATVAITGEAGISADPAPATTDASGLARIELAPVAPPILLTAKATRATEEGKWHGVVGAVVGVPVPSGSGFVKSESRAIELLGSPTWNHAYWDLFQDGVRVGGGRVPMANGHALVSLPEGVTGATDLVASSSAIHPSADDLVHAGTFPLVIDKDAIDAFGTVSTSPRFEDRITKSPAGSYDAIVAASIAAAAPAIPKVRLAVDGIGAAVKQEEARGQTVRRAASVAIVGGGLLELGLMIALGVVFQRRSIADELRDLDEEGEAPPKPQPMWSARVLAIVVSSLGIVALVFAALATMAWGLK